MKKSKKVGNRTDSNFFTSEFKLTSTQFPKHHRQHKMFSTMSQMKQGLLDEGSQKIQKVHNKEGRPIIEQLRLLTCTKEDDFKLPQSVSKRSMSKKSDKSKEKKATAIEIFQHFYQETRVVEEKKRSMGYMQCVIAQRKYKPLSVKNLMKDKLEKTALEKFKDAVNNQNNQTQNQISEKKAEALYMLLKSARKKQEDHPPKHQQSYSRRQQGQPNRTGFDVPIHKEKQNAQHTKPSFESRKDEKNSQQISETREEQSIGLQDMISRNTKELLGKLKNNGLQQSIANNKPNVVLEFDQKQNFDDSSDQDFSDLQLQMESKIVKNSQTRKLSSKNLQEKDQTIAYPKEIVKQQQLSKEKQKQLSFKRFEEKKNEEPDFMADIPSAKVITSAGKVKFNDKIQRQSKKIPTIKLNDCQKEQQFNRLKNYQQEQQRYKPKNQQQRKPIFENPPKPLAAPPKLNTVQNVPKQIKNKIDYRPQDFEDDQLQEICFDNKKPLKDKKQQAKPQQQTKPPPKLQVKPQAKKQIPQSKPQSKKVTLPEPPISQAQRASEPGSGSKPQAQSSKPQGQGSKPQGQSSFDPLDELQFFIEKIQDIGQYRINSKDLYNDKTISKQLMQSYKVCSYYMAHQFLYLSKRTCDHFKADDIRRDYYTITCQQLNELKKEGQLQFLVETSQTNMQQAKKLLKKCYQQSKLLLKKEQQILLLDGKTNYHMKCCNSLIKEFRLIYGLYEKKPQSETIQKRCCYLIEMFNILKLLNGQEIKECQQLEEIKDYKEHIKTYKNLLMTS